MKKLLFFTICLLIFIPSTFADRVIDCGDGKDTVIYIGKLEQYNIRDAGALTEVKGHQGTDTLSYCEYIRFDDKIIRTSDLLPVPLIWLPEEIELTEGQYVDITIQPVYEIQEGNFPLEYDTLIDSSISRYDSTKYDIPKNDGSDFTRSLGLIRITPSFEDHDIRIETVENEEHENLEIVKLILSGDDVLFLQGEKVQYQGEVYIKIQDNDPQTQEKQSGNPKAILLKNKILSKRDLENNVSGYKKYIDTLDQFISLHKNDTQRLQEIHEKISVILPDLGISSKERRIYYILNYLQALIELELYYTE